jgi:hypothetical protein
VAAPDSALSLRVFFKDLTAAGRQAAAWKQRKDNLNENVAPETPVPETPAPDPGFEGLEPKDGDEKDGFAINDIQADVGEGPSGRNCVTWVK